MNFRRSSTPASKNPHGGKHVTITVRETKTERMTPVNQGEIKKYNLDNAVCKFSE